MAAESQGKHLSWLHSCLEPKRCYEQLVGGRSGFKASKIPVFLQIFGCFSTKPPELSVSRALQDARCTAPSKDTLCSAGVTPSPGSIPAGRGLLG